MQALMIIDMQNDFVDHGGRALVAQAAQTVPTIAALLAHWRQQQWPVIHVIRSHQADGCDSERFRRHAPVCVANTWGALPYPSLAPLADEMVLIKTRFSAFYNTELAQYLAANGISDIAITGTQLPNCVRGTAADGLYRDLDISVVTDACSAQNQAVASANLQDLENMGARLIHSSALLAPDQN
ncbi:isochorismatase family cysteine hydrolase [uncultured Ferrimonas sp.]|uniref:cysteine hydrolase family protein n=1 Tax=uncultured Ferrimonas sp. TaxID=432640 RepID=UPI00262FF1EA|nr:isochorismatase family cysteine hydrolase [uncultured Ferrimonas sp.]